MGAGKSTVGRLLAERADRSFDDTDMMLQRRLGRTIPEIFRLYGEDTFRAHETSILRTLEPSPTVLATGGGIVLREENWTEFRRLGTTIFLCASPETLLARLESSKKKRPLLEFPDWKEKALTILEKRMPLYQQADITISMDNAPLDEAADRVYAALQSGGYK